MQNTRPLLDIQNKLISDYKDLKGQENVMLGVKTSDGKGYLLNLKDFEETLITEDVMNVGKLNPWIKGISSWRGRVFTLIDMSSFWGCENNNYIEENNFYDIFGTIIHEKYGKPWALLWSGGNAGLINVTKWEKLKENLENWFLETYKDASGEEWKVLNLTGLLEEERLNKVI